MEEVIRLSCPEAHTHDRQTLRDEMAMEVDEDEDNTQQPKAVADYGIEIEFDSLEDEDREVRQALHVRITAHWRL
jgi:hypothetical protein